MAPWVVRRRVLGARGAASARGLVCCRWGCWCLTSWRWIGVEFVLLVFFGLVPRSVVVGLAVLMGCWEGRRRLGFKRSLSR